ncbi:hypothetical protein VTL71DRAFT_9037 [Oculimacula yallundae]|uniref:Uncharacterized protein n=1 Tax=Oculimacula yallundae TaxID=86028 RepID=A0ABR4BTL4_9HELO
MKIGALLSSFFTPSQLASEQKAKSLPSRQQNPQMSFTYRPTIPATSMLLDRRDIPSRLFRAEIDLESGESPGTVGFTASITSYTSPKTTTALYNQVLNHIRREYGEETIFGSPFISVWSDKRIVEDEIVRFRTRERGYVPGLERSGGPGDGWVEEGRGKPWRVWAVTGNKIKNVFRVRDILGWNGGDEAGGEEFLVWKHIGPEAVYAAEGGHYDCIRSKRVEEIKDDEGIGKWKKELEAQFEAEAEKEGCTCDAESTDDDDDVEGGVSIFEEGCC